VGLGLTFFVKDKPHSIGQHPDGIDPDAPISEEAKSRAKRTGVHQTKEDWTFKEAVRTKVVWLQLVCMISQVWSLYLVTVHGVLHLMDKDISRMEAASVISVLLLFSGIARFPTGVIADRIEPRKLCGFALFAMAISLFGIWKAPQNIILLLVIGATYGFFFGSTVILFSMLTANYFGPKAFAPLMGFISPIFIGFAAPVPVLAGLLYDHYKTYDPAFIPIIILLLAGAGIGWFLYPPEKKIQLQSPKSL
jgi:MFS family permease